MLFRSGSGGSQEASREATDKGADGGKASMLPSFTTGYGLDMPSEEPTIMIEMHFKATDQAL